MLRERAVACPNVQSPDFADRKTRHPANCLEHRRALRQEVRSKRKRSENRLNRAVSIGWQVCLIHKYISRGVLTFRRKRLEAAISGRCGGYIRPLLRLNKAVVAVEQVKLNK